MKQYRWPLLALGGAVVLFVAALVSRSLSPDPIPAPPTDSTAIAAVGTVAADSTVVTEATGVAADVTPDAATSTPDPAALVRLDATVAATEVAQSSAENVRAVASDDGLVTFREAQVGQVQRLNPLYSSLNPVDADISALIYQGLARINSFGEAEPQLARQWRVSSDGLEVVVVLREDVLWHDGERFSADDVLLTMQLLGDDGFDGDESLRRFWHSVEVEKITDYIVRFRLAQPLASFISNYLTIGILPAHALAGTPASALATHPFNFTPIGTGPYQLEALGSDDGQRIDRVDLRLSPNFLATQQDDPSDPSSARWQIDRMRFRLFDDFSAVEAAIERGEVDGYAARTTTESRQLQSLAGTSTIMAVDSRSGMLIYNWDTSDDVPFFSDQRIRNALALGINRVTPVETYLSSRAIVSDSPLSPNSWAYDQQLIYPDFDPARARTLLEGVTLTRPATAPSASEGDDNTDTNGDDTPGDEASADDSESGETRLTALEYAFSILVVEEDTSVVSVAQEIANQWNNIGMTVTVDAVARDVYQRRLDDGDFQAAIVELPLPPDPDLYTLWHAGQNETGLNYGAASDDRLSELIEKARRDPSGQNRISEYRRLQETFISRAVAIPLYTPLFVYSVSSDVEGVQLGFIATPADRFETLRDWHFVQP